MGFFIIFFVFNYFIFSNIYCKRIITEEYDSIAVNHRTRLITNVVFTAAVAVIIAVALFPILDMSAYTVDDLNGSVIRAFLWSLAPTAAIIGGVFTVTSIFDKSFLREIDQLKALIASTTPSDVPLSRSYEKEKKLFRRITGFVLMGVAVAFIAVGVANGDLVSVIKKAVAICTWLSMADAQQHRALNVRCAGGKRAD